MPFNGSGTFTRDNGAFTGSSVWADDAAVPTKITAVHHDTHDQDMADGLSLCLTEDGQNVPTSHLSWINATRYVSALGGSSSNYTATLSPAPGSYYAGMVLRGVANHSNTGTATLNVNGLGTRNIYRITGQPLVGSEIVSGCLYEFVYDGTQFILANERVPVQIGPFASENVSAHTVAEPMLFGDLKSNVTSIPIPHNRYVVALSMRADVPITAGSITIEVFENGSGTGKTLVMSSGTGASGIITPEAFAAGAVLGLQISASGASGPFTMSAVAWVI